MKKVDTAKQKNIRFYKMKGLIFMKVYFIREFHLKKIKAELEKSEEVRLVDILPNKFMEVQFKKSVRMDMIKDTIRKNMTHQDIEIDFTELSFKQFRRRYK